MIKIGHGSASVYITVDYALDLLDGKLAAEIRKHLDTDQSRIDRAVKLGVMDDVRA